MIFEDERAPELDRLSFLLHLGDFIYEIVWYPEDRPQGMYGRRLRDIVRYEHGEKVRDFHIPMTVSDYRAVYRAYLHDPDLQDARARWPFGSAGSLYRSSTERRVPRKRARLRRIRPFSNTSRLAWQGQAGCHGIASIRRMWWMRQLPSSTNTVWVKSPTTTLRSTACEAIVLCAGAGMSN